MAEVTQADRVKAITALGYDGWDYSVMADGPKLDVDAVAVALAAEREKARAPFLALAAEWHERADELEDEADLLGRPQLGHRASGLHIAATALEFALRRAAEESQ